MPRARGIKPSFFLNEVLAECDIYSRMLFIGLWCLADREGRLEDRPKRIGAFVYPYEDIDADKALHELEEAGFIERYEVDGNYYIQVLNFSKHQNPHIKEAQSTIPAPPETDDHHTSTIQEPDKHDESPSDSGLRTVDSGPRTVDSGPLTADTGLPDGGGGATANETKILNVLKTVKNYPFDAKTDLEAIRNLAADYPDVDLLQEVKHWATWVLDKPLQKGKSKPRSQIRNWVRKSREFNKRGSPKKATNRRDMSFEEFMKEVDQYAP